MADRYYLPQLAQQQLAEAGPSAGAPGVEAVLDGAEAHHLCHVMRAQVGDEVALFDGAGAEYRARVARVGRRQVELTVFARQQVDRELPGRLVLAVALPKGERRRWLVEKLVELGVHELWPLVTERSVALPGDAHHARLERTVIEASKQCGRNRLLTLAPAVSWPALLASAPATATRWVAHPNARWLEMSHSPVIDAEATWLAIGPEGGLTTAEVAQAQAAGWQSLDLGPRVLRVETAAVALAARVALGGLY